MYEYVFANLHFIFVLLVVSSADKDFSQNFRHHCLSMANSYTPVSSSLLGSSSLSTHILHTNFKTVSSARLFCSDIKNLTHVDQSGKASMVDVSEKPITTRTADAIARIYVGDEVARLIHTNNLKKGDVLSVAQLAGILGAKKTSDLIPLCHNITISSVKVKATLDLDNCMVILEAKVRCSGQTGVEMEALCAVSIAALTVYDMCKAVTHDMVIKDVQLLSKTGGQRGDFKR